MARYGSNSTEEPGQYPTTAWSMFGLNEQNFGSGAPGSSGSKEQDTGGSNEPGQYPARETVTGVALGGTGAPGSQGITNSSGGPDSITYSKPTFYKSEYELDENFNGPGDQGYREDTIRDSISGPNDWTQAADGSYGGGIDIIGVKGNTPESGSGRFQTGAGSVMYGGRLNGTEHTSKHPSWSGPGT